MVQTFSDEFKNFAKQGSRISDKEIKNSKLYEQYIMLYNHVDQRFYEEEYIPDFSYEKLEQLKEKLWSNPFYRYTVKFLKKTRIMNLLEKMGIKSKIKEKVKKVYLSRNKN